MLHRICNRLPCAFTNFTNRRVQPKRIFLFPGEPGIEQAHIGRIDVLTTDLKFGKKCGVTIKSLEKIAVCGVLGKTELCFVLLNQRPLFRSLPLIKKNTVCAADPILVVSGQLMKMS